MPKFLAIGTALCLVPIASSAQEVAPTPSPNVVGSTAQQTVELGKVEVKDDTGRTNSAQTENSGSYSAGKVTVAKGATIRQTPQSVTVITRQQLDDRNLDTLESAVEQTTGATVLQVDAGRSSFFFRGYSLDTIQVDGVSTAFTSNFATAPDLFAYDHVEILRGPAGLFQGAGEPAGGINLARKRALDQFQAIAGVAGGTFDLTRVEADLTGPLTKSGNVRARLLGSYEQRDLVTDFGTSRKPMVYGTIEVDPIRDTTISVGVTRQEQDYTPFAGLPAFADGRQADVPRSRFIGALWNEWQAGTTDVFVEADHHPNSGVEVKLTGRRIERSSDAIYATPNTAIDPATGNTRLNVVRLDYRQIDKSADGYVSAPFTIGGLAQNVLIGANYREWAFDQGTGNGSPYLQNVFDPVYDAPRQTVAVTNRFQGVQKQYGVYGQARAKPIDGLTVILGGRLSHYEIETTRVATGDVVSGSKASGRFTPYAGFVVDVAKPLSLYVSYASIFQPQTQTDASGNVLPPRSGRQYEAGVKAELADGRINAHAAVFRINDRNRAITDPANPLFVIAAGEVRSKGAEAEVTGLIADGWNLTAGYSYNDRKFVIAAPGVTGTVFQTQLPRHTANLWSRYTLADGISIGGGARYSSSIYSRSGNATFRQTGYVLLSAQAGYQLSPNVELTVNANNLLDKRYYTYVNTPLNGNRFGEPRTLRVTLNTKW